MLNAFGNHKHFARCNVNDAIAKINAQIALDHDESLIGVLMVVPDKIAPQLHDFELIVVHLGDNFRRPLLSK